MCALCAQHLSLLCVPHCPSTGITGMDHHSQLFIDSWGSKFMFAQQVLYPLSNLTSKYCAH